MVKLIKAEFEEIIMKEGSELKIAVLGIGLTMFTWGLDKIGVLNTLSVTTQVVGGFWVLLGLGLIAFAIIAKPSKK
jgi:hypothetical protein